MSDTNNIAWLREYARTAVEYRKRAANPYFPRIPSYFSTDPNPTKNIKTGDSFNSLCRINDTTVATGHQQQGVKVWDIPSETCISTFACTHPYIMKDVWSMAAVQDDQIVISSWFDKRLLMFNWRTGKFVCEFEFPQQDTVALGKKNLIFFGDRYLIAGTKGGWLYVWDTRDKLRTVYHEYVSTGGWNTAIEVIEDSTVAIVSQSGSVTLFDMHKKQVKMKGYKNHHGWAMCVALITPDILCSGSFEGDILTWHADDLSRQRPAPTVKFGCIRDIVALGSDYAVLCHSNGVDVVNVNDITSKVSLSTRGCINACVLPDGSLVCGIQAGDICVFKVAETRSGRVMFFDRLWRCKLDDYFDDLNILHQ